MSIYTTPLQFGYFLALLMAILLGVRGYKEERLSDKMLGSVLFLLAMEIQDYTFGFAGINVLWNELNGFPRGTALLFGPAVYFYLRSQLNRGFKLGRRHFWHLLPWLIPFIIDLTIFLNGAHVVQEWQNSTLHSYLTIPRQLILWASYIYYFTLSLRLYWQYREWAKHQFSNQDLISFIWFRNLLYFMIFGILFKESMGMIDGFFNLDFYQDWWWNLAMVAIIFYVAIWGYAQIQPAQIRFKTNGNIEPGKDKKLVAENLGIWKNKIQELMEDKKPYLEPQLNLKSLATKLKTNPSILSAAINQNFKKNFNDLINEYRVNEYLKLSKQEKYDHYTLLALALECGFNSKSTFNRTFKKITGRTPKEVKNTILTL
jgi:AraC-like DNA-binding protein